jgi:hypothetical protein
MKIILKEIDHILCNAKKTFLSRGVKGVFFTNRDFQELLNLFEQLQRGDNNNDD